MQVWPYAGGSAGKECAPSTVQNLVYTKSRLGPLSILRFFHLNEANPTPLFQLLSNK